jgi:hypothetical protein
MKKNGSVTLGDALVYIERHKLGGDRVIHLEFLKNTPQINLDIDIENGN